MLIIFSMDVTIALKNLLNRLKDLLVLLISSENVNTTLKVLIDFFDIHFLELQEKALNDLCESKLFFCHLLKYVEKNIKTSEDFINIENLICDYHNILVYIVNSDSTFKNRFENFYFSKPIFIDENNYKIIDGIEIYFEHKPNLKCVKGYYGENDFIILEKDVHYFISEFNNLYCPSDILRKLNLKEIELVSFNVKIMVRFNVYDYINV
ncbi:hypothetical protein NBO_11g0027 [Nosema bombycis CQ1]|uniref:Uncharacterized protein n=1 Tax=Nosema bombycis (strain CQ1 / CVCC 102059) TaxID=578461 RepID=R0ML58_NOSB1|nr:hypothetical protein NBO_11g0027 [Nosema bombycis CQ1]|eukprot:EOB14955.1 hypothetical protein NBO_11g0027 [Nosema bombycis CQ1]